MFGRDWRAVQNYVKTRTSTQSRSHAQKFLAKIKRKGLTLKDFLDSIDFQNLEKLSAIEIGYDEEQIKNEEESAEVSATISDSELSKLPMQLQKVPATKPAP